MTASTPMALVGGMAVCIRAEPRPTSDVDIAIAVADDAAATSLVARLESDGYRVLESIPHDDTGRIATTRLSLIVSDAEVTIDLFFASSGVEAEVVADATRCKVTPGLVVPVSSVGHLIAVKLCWRPSEKRTRDLRALITAASAADLEDAHRLATLITERGYHRGRDLQMTMTDWITQAAD